MTSHGNIMAKGLVAASYLKW